MTRTGTIKWVRLGELIEIFDLKNSEGKPYPFYGINKDKTFMPTVADTNELDNTKYKVVEKGCFVFNGMHVGRDIAICIAVYAKDNPIVVSPAYTTFMVKDELVLLPEFLFLQLSRVEFGRYGWFLCDGSVRGGLDWKRFCDIEILLPPIEVQRELVDTYNGLKTLAEQNEALIPHLSAACQAYIVDCRAKYPSVSLGKYIEVYDCKNMDGKPYPFYGINKDKTFMPTVADTNKLDNTKYKVVKKGVFVFNGMHVGRDVSICIAVYDKENPIVVSPAYTTFMVKDESVLLPEFLFLQLSRIEVGRYGWFLCDASVRSGLDWKRFCDIEIPLPPIDVQQAIVDVYHCMERAKQIASQAREKLKTLCPALVQRAAHS